MQFLNPIRQFTYNTMYIGIAILDPQKPRLYDVKGHVGSQQQYQTPLPNHSQTLKVMLKEPLLVRIPATWTAVRFVAKFPSVLVLAVCSL